MRERLATLPTVRASGRVAKVNGHHLQVRGLRVHVGEALSIDTRSGRQLAQVVAVDHDSATAMLLGESTGLGRGDRVRPHPQGAGILISDDLVGRVIDAMGRPLDGGPPIFGLPMSLDSTTPQPMERIRINEALPVGVRVLDTMATTGRGQRMGIFGGSGVGKSTLLGMMARGAAADVVVLGLVGERGREVREFVEDDLGPDGRSRAITVVATSEQPPLVRLRAGYVATRIAEWFADRGANVLLMLDSLTRLAMAQREVGLASGEPPTARGYTPSVFSMMPDLLERAGPRTRGTITGFYTVLVEGDDMNDPIADAARSILDGHIILDRRLGVEGRWPAVDPLSSMSRLADRLVDDTAPASAVRAALAAAEEVRDLVEVGAYVPGTNPEADIGLAAKPDIVDFFKQSPQDVSDFNEAWTGLRGLTEGLAQ